MNIGQLAQVVRIAQAVLALLQQPVRCPAIVDERTREQGQQPQSIEGLFAALGVQAQPSQAGAGQHVHPVQGLVDPQAGFVGMRNGRLDQGPADGLHRGLQPLGGLLHGRQHGCIGHGQAEEVAHQLGRALGRQHVVLAHVHHRRQRMWPVLHRC